MFSICWHKKMHLLLHLMCTKYELICSHRHSFMAKETELKRLNYGPGFLIWNYMFNLFNSVSLASNNFQSPQYVEFRVAIRVRIMNWMPSRDVCTLFDVVADTSARQTRTVTRFAEFWINFSWQTGSDTLSVLGPETVTVSATRQLCLHHWRTRPRTLNVSGGGVLPHLLNQSTAV
jgi:hypothetical protein